METIRKKYNLIVNYDKENKEVTVLNETFEYLNGFKGATGSVFQIVSKTEFYETIEPYLNNDKELLIYMAENFGPLNREMIEGVDSSEEALKTMFFDLSYEDTWDYLREELGLTEDEAYIFNCTGGGRCFDKDFKGNCNQILSTVIREYESK
jgi:hypothetical protein